MSKTILGIDLGSNSLGWALLSADDDGKPTDIIDTGVRIFPKAVEEKTPTPKNVKRRTSRLARRTIQRRARRKKKLMNYLVSLSLLPKTLLTDLQPEGILNSLGDPYLLRKKALDQDLSSHELGRVLLHLVQRRGFLSNKKTLLGRDMLDDPDVLAVLGEDDLDESDGAEETAFKADISLLRAEIRENGCRTLGEYLAKRPLHECKRNRLDEHIRTDRQMYLEELSLIFERQTKCHKALTEEVRGHIEHIIFYQRPLNLNKDRVGKCSLEPSKKRAAMARLEYQRFRYLQDVNNLSYFDPNTEEQIKLTEADKQKLYAFFETKESPTFPQIRKLIGLDKSCEMNLETQVKKMRGNTTAVKIQKCYTGWSDLSADKQEMFVEDLISIKKKSALKQRLMSYWKMTGVEAVQVCLLELEPGYGSLSLKALRKLLPHLEAGLIYSDSRQAAGYGYEVEEVEAQDTLGLPPEIPNPIVSKGLGELRRVVNALIAEYGKPDVIRIEMARDLEMNTKRYKSFMAQQSKNTKSNDKASDAYKKIAQEHPKLQLSSYPSREQKIRYRLWLDQSHMCPYSCKQISLSALFSADIEVDHILPYSQSLNDSYMNKVVCFAKENQIKGQKTPKDAFGASTDKWEQITQAISRWPRELSSKRDAFYRTEGELLERDFIGNQLTDTRYISKEAGTYLKSLGSDVTFTRGAMTSWLRHQWEFNDLLGITAEKERTDHRHHAIDAVVTACIDLSLYRSLVAQSNDLERSKSNLTMKDLYVTPPIIEFKDKLAQKLDSLIVSHVPQRKIAGALHEETGVGFIEGIGTVYRQRLDSDFDAKKADKIIDVTVRAIVLGQLNKHGGDPKKAFGDNNKVYHSDGKTLIKRVRVVQSKTTLKKLEENKFATRDRNGKAFKWHAYGNTHHVEILKNIKTGKYKGDFVTVAEAALRCRSKNTPIINKDHGEEWEYQMSLHVNDLVQLTVADDTEIYRIQKLNMVNAIVSLRLHTAATIRISAEGIEKSAGTLVKDYKMAPVLINSIGKLMND